MLTYRAIQKTKREGAKEPRTPARIRNRIPELLPHISWFSIEGQARLAADVGVSRSTITRLVNGTTSPSYRLVVDVTEAISRRLGGSLKLPSTFRLDPREIFTTDGTYPTPSACDLCGCGGCIPDYAFNPSGERHPEFKDMQPGDWCVTPALTN